MDTMQAFEEIERAAADDTTEVRECAGIQIGQVVRQGDIYLHRVAADHPRGEKVGNKLAVGEGANARHVAEAPSRCFAGVQLPHYCRVGTFLGPLIVSDAPFLVGHPEHAAVRLGAGTYQTTHQMDPRTLDRVRD